MNKENSNDIPEKIPVTEGPVTESENIIEQAGNDVVDSSNKVALQENPTSEMAHCLDPHNSLYRFIILFFNCMLTFGSYFCFDMPSVLQSQFEGNFSCSENTTTNETSCCSDCLGMRTEDYNLLYAVYAWTNAVVVIGSGFLVDKMGNRIGVFLFSFLCVLGSSIFALGTHFRGEAAMLPLMLIGRLIFGAGNGSLTIVQNRITSFWFMGKELALAFGVTLAFSRLGSVLNFFLTDNIYSAVGLTWTLWGGAILCGLGFLSAIVLSFLDIFGMRKLGREASIQSQSKRLSFLDIRYFSLSYWLLALTIMFFYNGVFPFVADASKFIQDKYGYESRKASYIVGAVYDVSMVMSPFLGGIIDIVGKRGVLAVSCAALTLPVFGLLAFSYVPPLVSTLWLGFTYSIAAASLWPSIPLIVSHATLGTAMGLTTSIQMIGTGISNLIVGQILGKNLPKDEKWKYVMLYLLMNSVACVVTASFLNLINYRRGGVLNFNKQRMRTLLVEYDENDSGTSNIAYEQTDAASVGKDDGDKSGQKYRRLND